MPSFLAPEPAPPGNPAEELPLLVDDDDDAPRRVRLLRPGTSELFRRPVPSKVFTTPPAFDVLPQQHPPQPKPQPNGKSSKEKGVHKHQRVKRQTKRLQQAKDAARGYQVREAMIVKYAEPLFIDLNDKDAKDLPHAEGAWVGVATQQALDADLLGKLFTWAELRKRGFKYYAWDGLKRVAIIDRLRRIILMLAGRPPDADWDASCERINVAMSEARGQLAIKTCPKERRGDFNFINTGVSYGRGQQYPMNTNHKGNAQAVDKLLDNPDLRRVAGYMASTFAVSAPKLYQHYEQNMAILMGSQPDLKIPFNSPIYTNATFNFGPGAATTIHVDTSNLPYGWCSIIPFGHFNADTSAMFILAQLGLVVRFQRHSLINAPSSSMGHGNTVLASGDARSSFTMYTKGALFRWVEYGLQTEDALRKEDPVGFRDVWKARPARWEHGLNLLSKHSELEADIRNVFNVHPPSESSS